MTNPTPWSVSDVAQISHIESLAWSPDGTNLADVGFDLDEQSGRIVSICAIDNLMKGAAGSAVQCLNLMCDYPETTALEMIGLHPY
jgi:N-acetyl-gamma-glutamylphosphate reductase